MINKLKLITLAASLFTLQSKLAISQSLAEYQMQPVVLQTRWAKDVKIENPLNEYPRPQMVRKSWINLNGLWNYAITRKDAIIPEKYNGNILVPYPIESALSGVKKTLQPDQNLWYKKKFTYAGKGKVILHFGAVDFEATVFLNGREVGKHTGGYTEFSFDVTSLINKGVNEIVIKVWDPSDRGYGPHGKQVLNPQNIYYTPSSGIWQTVWLETVPNTYIEELAITPDLDKSTVFITPKININEKGYMVEVTAKSKGQTIKRSTGLVNQQQSLRIANLHPWSPDDPFLYDLVVRILYQGKVVDEIKSYFGMRKISIMKDKKGYDRIALNNKPYYNLGTLDQGFWPDGLYTAPTDEALQFDIKAIKTMGFNTIRKHIKVEPARWYYHCDRLGMLVWQDMVNPNQLLPSGAKQEFEKEAKETVNQLRNYPSIITWVLFNEKWGQFDQERLTKELKSWDPNRLVNGHSGEYLYVNEKLRSPSPNAYIYADMTDVHSYPNPMISEKQSGKAQVCGEFGGIGVAIPNHEWNDLKGWGYIEVKPAELVTKYKEMSNKLQLFKSTGLSGSIYTQPFDVEGEENGLLTYDREVLKIPLDQIRRINLELLGQLKSKTLNNNLYIAKDADPTDNDDRYLEMLHKFESGKRDSNFLRRLTLMALRKQDQSNATRVGNVFFGLLKNKFTDSNIDFIKKSTRTFDDAGFEFFQKNALRIDESRQVGYSKNIVKLLIVKLIIDPSIKNTVNPDWVTMRSELNKFGEIGDEVYLQSKAYYDYNKCKGLSPCPEMLQSLTQYIDKYIESESAFQLNNFAFRVFEISNDRLYLEKALNWQSRVLQIESASPSPESYDSYANLLFKLGRTSEALEWEQKALKLENEVAAKNNIKPNSVYEETLRKMKTGTKTWPDIN